MLACDRFQRLGNDDCFLLTLEVGLARLELINLTERQSSEVWTFLQESLSLELSSEVENLGRCLLNLHQCVMLQANITELAAQVELHQLGRATAKAAATITNPAFNAAGLQAYAWYCICLAYATHMQAELVAKTAKKAHRWLLKCVVSCKARPRLAAETTMLLALFVDRPALLKFAEEHVRRTFAIITPGSAPAMLQCLKRFIELISLDCKQCMAARLADMVCTNHGAAYSLQPLPFKLEEMLLEDVPQWLAPVPWYFWLQSQQARLNACMADDLSASELRMVQSALAGYSFSLAPMLLMALFDRIDQDIPDTSQLPDRLEPLLFQMSALHGGDDGPPEDVDGANPLEAWRAIVDPFLDQHGWNLSLTQLLERFQSLHPGDINGLRNSELLRLLLDTEDPD
jgi:hypothetical protein